MLKIPFGSQLQRARKELKLNQDNVAKEAGVSRSVIANLESGFKEETLNKIKSVFPEEVRQRHFKPVTDNRSQSSEDEKQSTLYDGETEDMILTLASLRRSETINLTGQWEAVWLTVVDKRANRNHEIVNVKKRLNGSWQFSNEVISQDNPDGGYLWIGRMELFDNNHLLGYYVAKDPSIRAKGTLCLEIQASGKEILGTWEGLNFDTMWANGLVAMCLKGESRKSPEELLERFKNEKPRMPYFNEIKEE